MPRQNKLDVNVLFNCSVQDTKLHEMHCEGERVGIKPQPPYKLRIFKGYKNVILRRDFANFLINHPVSLAMQEFMKDTMVPDEHTYATMSRIKHIDEIVLSEETCSQHTAQYCNGYCIWSNDKCILKSKKKNEKSESSERSTYLILTFIN